MGILVKWLEKIINYKKDTKEGGLREKKADTIKCTQFRYGDCG